MRVRKCATQSHQPCDVGTILAPVQQLRRQRHPKGEWHNWDMAKPGWVPVSDTAF